MTLDARVVIASVDTYLRFAEAVNRLDIQPQQQPVGMPGLVEELREGGGTGNGKGPTGVEDNPKEVKAARRGGDDDDEGKPAPRSRASSSRPRRHARRSRQQS